MRKQKNVLLLCLSFILMFASVSFAHQDKSLSDEDGVIAPLYEPHDCHIGISHQECETIVSEKDCGCYLYLTKCCCGKNMDFWEVYCDEHSL